MAKPTAAEKRFHLWVMEKPCCVSDCNQPSIFHHEKQPYPLPRRDHMYGVNICDPHHRELHVVLAWWWNKFKKLYNVWLPDIAKQNREEYETHS